jgi:hypothetical protein
VVVLDEILVVFLNLDLVEIVVRAVVEAGGNRAEDGAVLCAGAVVAHQELVLAQDVGYGRNGLGICQIYLITAVWIETVFSKSLAPITRKFAISPCFSLQGTELNLYCTHYRVLYVSVLDICLHVRFCVRIGVQFAAKDVPQVIF